MKIICTQQYKMYLGEINSIIKFVVNENEPTVF